MGEIVRVSDGSAVASARRMTAQCAQSLRLSEVAAGKAALVATELATNLVKHAGGGAIVFGADHTQERVLALVAIDKGNGIANVGAAREDGFSTAGSPGTGLGAIHRACLDVETFSLRERGTAILCRVGDTPPPARPYEIPSRFTVGGISVAKTGEIECGDAWTAVPSGDSITIALADGLGHGSFAATAAAAAMRVVREQPEADLERLMQDAHGALRPTRGAALALARIHATHSRVELVGAGNIAGSINTDDEMRRTVSMPGIVGHEMRRVQTFSYPWHPSSVLILHSDGLTTNWAVGNYPGLMQHHPALIAAVLYRDYARGNDDATVVVVKAS